MTYRQINPGEELFQWILNRYKRQKVDQDSWVSNMAREFNMEELEELLLRSTALMLLRRLLWNANWYESRYVDRDVTIEKFDKDYLLEIFGFEREDRLRIGRLTFAALDASKKDISTGLFKEMKKQASNRRQRCEIRGCIIDYDTTSSHNSFSLDHKWPHSLGGVSERWNLRVACRACNSQRQNIVEASDVHYEHFHVKTDWSADPGSSFQKELKNEFKIAALLHANFQCEFCGESVENMEEGVDFMTREREENFHMFNVQVTCKQHKK